MTATIDKNVPRLLAELDQDLDRISPWPPSDDANTMQHVLPLRHHVTNLIAKQAKCTKWRAGCTMRMLGRRARGGRGTLTSWEMLVTHKVLGRIIPDRSHATAGSVHEALDQRYLSPNKTFEHGKTRGGACHMRMVDRIGIANQ